MRRTAAALATGLVLALALGEGLVRLAASDRGGARLQLFRAAEYVGYDPLLGHALRRDPARATRFELPGGAFLGSGSHLFSSAAVPHFTTWRSP